ncbi:MAG: guanylate kinase [Rickettsiales bacterium]|jgi:guanylate kinase|nr:guanylate kinase [Rickettsiales bacterium]
MLKYDNFILILSAPSGTGKSTLVGKLMEQHPNFRYSISATTRAPRKGEQDGVQYYFITRDEFEEKITKGEFLEYAEVHGNYYGTPKYDIENHLSDNHDVILDIDYQGMKIITKYFEPRKVLKIFVLPPSLKELDRRLRKRNTDSEDVIQKRLSDAKGQIAHCEDYEYVLIDHNLEETFERIKSIILAKQVQNRVPDELDKFINDFR